MEPHTPQPKLSDTIMKRIEAGESSPRSRSYFLLRDAALWSAAFLALLLGALAVSTIIFRINNFSRALPPPEEGQRAHELYELFVMLPYVWLGILALFGYLAYREFRRTKQGYKYELSTVIVSLVVMSGILGTTLYVAGSGYAIDRGVGRLSPFPSDIESMQREHWLRPEQGLLVGAVSVLNEDGLILVDLKDQEWQVIIGDTLPQLPTDAADKGVRIGVRGTVRDADARIFVACHYRILELHGRGIFMPALRIIREEIKPILHDERNASTTRTNECEGVRPLNQ